MPARERIFCSRSRIGGRKRLLGLSRIPLLPSRLQTRHRRLLPARLCAAAVIPGPASRGALFARATSASKLLQSSTSPKYLWASPLVTSPIGSSTGASRRSAGSSSGFRGPLLAFCRGRLGFSGSLLRNRCALLHGRGVFAADFAVFALVVLLLAAGFLLAASVFLVLGADLAAGAADFVFFSAVMGKPVTFCSLRVAG